MIRTAALAIGKLARSILDFALPPRCAGCGTIVSDVHSFCTDWLDAHRIPRLGRVRDMWNAAAGDRRGYLCGVPGEAVAARANARRGRI